MKVTRINCDYTVIGPCLVDIRVSSGSVIECLKIDVESGEKLSIKEITNGKK